MKFLMGMISLLMFSAVYSQALSKEELEAQQNSTFKQNRISFNIGLANPTGDFAATNILDQESGFASTGLVIKANYAYLLSKTFGFTFDFTNSNFGVESEEIEELTKGVYSSFAKNVNYNIENYNLSQVTFGFMVTLGNEAKFYINPVIGYSIFRFAEESISGVYTQNNSIMAPPNVSFTETVISENDEGAFFAINWGVDIPISGETFVNINMQYYSMEYDFSGSLNYSDSAGNRGQFSLPQASLQVSAFQFGLGLSHYF